MNASHDNTRLILESAPGSGSGFRGVKKVSDTRYGKVECCPLRLQGSYDAGGLEAKDWGNYLSLLVGSFESMTGLLIGVHGSLSQV